MAYRVALAGAVVAPILMLAACDPVERADAPRFYADHCAACHGPTGRGDGPLAAGLDTPPSDLTGLARRNGGTFDFAYVMGVIDGYKAPERDMPRFGTLLAEAETSPFETGDGILTPTPIPLLALARHVESLQQP